MDFSNETKHTSVPKCFIKTVHSRDNLLKLLKEIFVSVIRNEKNMKKMRGDDKIKQKKKTENAKRKKESIIIISIIIKDESIFFCLAKCVYFRPTLKGSNFCFELTVVSASRDC